MSDHWPPDLDEFAAGPHTVIDTSDHLGWWMLVVYIGIPAVIFIGMALGWWQ